MLAIPGIPVSAAISASSCGSFVPFTTRQTMISPVEWPTRVMTWRSQTFAGLFLIRLNLKLLHMRKYRLQNFLIYSGAEQAVLALDNRVGTAGVKSGDPVGRLWNTRLETVPCCGSGTRVSVPMIGSIGGFSNLPMRMQIIPHLVFLKTQLRRIAHGLGPDSRRTGALPGSVLQCSAGFGRSSFVIRA